MVLLLISAFFTALFITNKNKNKSQIICFYYNYFLAVSFFVIFHQFRKNNVIILLY